MQNQAEKENGYKVPAQYNIQQMLQKVRSSEKLPEKPELAYQDYEDTNP
jgi:hypothetical protein